MNLIPSLLSKRTLSRVSSPFPCVFRVIQHPSSRIPAVEAGQWTRLATRHATRKFTVRATMGGQLSKALGKLLLRVMLTTGKLFGNKEMRILMLGLDAAGKTSALLHV